MQRHDPRCLGHPTITGRRYTIAPARRWAVTKKARTTDEFRIVLRQVGPVVVVTSTVLA